jgi:two-component system cell cycle response regulator
MDFQHIDLGTSAVSTILVVDDDPVIRRYLEAQLGRLGCRMLFAEHGAQAMELLQHEHPDLVLLDIVMPGMDGFEVCRRIKGSLETHDIPVIHLTALKGEAKEQSFSSGADDFLNKPPNFVELRSRIRSHLLIRSLLRERTRLEAARRTWQWDASRRPRVLVVESQEALRTHVAELLTADGLDVRCAENLQACVRTLQEGLPDLLVLDHVLDDGSGTAFASQLRNYAQSRDLPVLVLCSRAALEKEITGVDAGPVDYLTKPFQPAELRIRIAVLLRQAALVLDRESSRFGPGKHYLLDPATGAFTEAFLEAHLDLLQKALVEASIPLALLAAAVPAHPGAWGEMKDQAAKAAALLNSTLGPGEALCRVAERIFVLVLPGLDRAKLQARVQGLREVGFTGALAGLIVPRRTPAAAILPKLAASLQKSEGA